MRVLFPDILYLQHFFWGGGGEESLREADCCVCVYIYIIFHIFLFKRKVKSINGVKLYEYMVKLLFELLHTNRG